MFTLLSGNSEQLCTWLKTLPIPKPGTTYFHFLSSHDRTNREQLDYEGLKNSLHKTSSRASIFNEYICTLSLRKAHARFSVQASQQIIFLDQRIFCIKRCAPDGSETLYALFNISSEEVKLEDSWLEGVDILHAESLGRSITLQPYGYRWIVSTQGEVG